MSMPSIIRILPVICGCILTLASCREKEMPKADPPAPAVKVEGLKPPAPEKAAAQEAVKATEAPPAEAAAVPATSPQTPASRDAARKQAMERFKKATGPDTAAPAGK